ncbi:MAG: tRNA (adenosine(37)-N6)-threonylcarbamoyltransferase complex ATPase subunit type 1 TsaE [Clostridium sp.]|nr:tRNA (adenosine(37)-N6)-threonylcarbamoyltransferase complex ATPase subunit type 1 TsaE [Clostridium sp.]
MEKIFTITVNNLDETNIIAEKFAKAVKNSGAFVCLYGDIGAGKTAFTKLVAKHLDVKEKVTSPSFVIINEYLSGILPVYHFDLYRLEREGVKTIIDELTEYSRDGVLTFVEWAEFSDFELPFDRIEISIEYIDENKRKFTFNASGDNYKKILEGMQK